MRRFTITFLAACLALSVSCSTTENFERFLADWVGSDIQKLLNAWKEPDEVNMLPNGNLEYSFNVTKKYGLSLPDACVVYFEADKVTKKILRIRHEGTRCKRAPSFV